MSEEFYDFMDHNLVIYQIQDSSFECLNVQRGGQHVHCAARNDKVMSEVF